MKKNIILAVSLLGICVAASAQKITVKDTTFTTYGFSDPNAFFLQNSNENHEKQEQCKHGPL